MSDTLRTLNNHVSIRHYTDEDISEETVRDMLNAARRSPTSSNIQAYSFVVVRNPETKKELAVLAGNQKHIETCPVFVAICADITRLRRACEMHGETLAQNLENSMVAIVDASLVGMSLNTVAESLGYGTVMIGGMRNHPKEAADVLGLPNGVFVVYGMCIGVPARRTPQKPRLHEDAVIHYERFDTSKLDEHLTNYDAELAEHYREEGRETPDNAWTGVIASKFSSPRRDFLKSTLEAMGFDFG